MDLEGLLAAYTDACNRFDMDAIEQMFVEDAVYASPGLAHEMRGRTAIMSAFRAYFKEHNEQVSEDHDIKITAPRIIENRWSLHSLGKERHGWQRIEFNPSGKITRIDVNDN